MGRLVRRPRRRLLAATLVVFGAVAALLLRAQGDDPGLRLSVGPVTKVESAAADQPAEPAPHPAPPAARRLPARRATPGPPRRQEPARTPAPAPAAAPATAAPAAAPPVATAAPVRGPVGRSGPRRAGRPLPAGPAATPTPAQPAATATPAPEPRTYAVEGTDVRMSPLGGTGPVHRAVPRYRALPGPGRPYATYLGRVAGTSAAAFVVVPGTSVLGGDCRPTRAQCAVVTVAPGRHAWIGFADGMAWRLDVLGARRLEVASRAEARAARTRFSPAGGCGLARLHVTPGSLVALGVDLEVPATAAELAC